MKKTLKTGLSIILSIIMLLTAIPLTGLSVFRTEVNANEILYGDTDGDGLITAKDARFILRASVGLESSDNELLELDGHDGITAADARLALRGSIGLEDIGPYGFEVPNEIPERTINNIKLTSSIENDTVIVTVSVENPVDFIAYEMELNYDAEMLTYNKHKNSEHISSMSMHGNSICAINNSTEGKLKISSLALFDYTTCDPLFDGTEVFEEIELFKLEFTKKDNINAETTDISSKTKLYTNSDILYDNKNTGVIVQLPLNNNKLYLMQKIENNLLVVSIYTKEIENIFSIETILHFDSRILEYVDSNLSNWLFEKCINGEAVAMLEYTPITADIINFQIHTNAPIESTEIISFTFNILNDTVTPTDFHLTGKFGNTFRFDFTEAINICVNHIDENSDFLCDKCQQDLYTAKGTFSNGNLEWRFYEDGTLIISGNGEMEDFEWDFETPWYKYQSKIKKVVIKDGVLNIGEYAFYECTNLTDVDFGNTIKSIDRYAFRICSSLSHIELPDSLEYIGFSAFESCYSLKSIEIPDSVTEIDSNAFAFCYNLTAIKLSDNITEIADSLFFYCISLTDVVIPEKVTRIGSSAFSNCESLVSIKIPANVESIGDPDLGETAFYKCTKLSYIDVDANNKNFTNDNNGVLFDKNKELLILYPIGNNNAQYIVPESVTAIGDYAFTRSSLTKITLPKNLSTIGHYAFSNCANIEEINLPDKMDYIGLNAFTNCVNLKQISIPSGIEEINFGTFSGCKNLTNIIIPDDVKFINNCAFEYCKNLTSVTMSKNIISIGNWAFDSCVNITSINLPESLLNLHDSAFTGCDNLKEVILSNPYTQMSPGGMYDEGGESIFPEETVIYGYEDSSAEKYAQEFNREFVSLGTYNKPLITVLNGTCGENAKWSIDNSLTLTISGTGKISTPSDSNGFNLWECYGTMIDKIIIEEGITEFHYEFAFSFEEITIPSSVPYIDKNIFSEKEELKKITFLNPDIEIKTDENTTNAIHPNTTIYGYDNSTAHKYAEKFGNKFVSLNKPHTHSYTSTVTKPASCKEAGVKTFTCECGDGYTESIAKLTTHKWGEWKITAAATYEKAGTEQRSCSVCGKAESRAIAKLEYTEVSFKEDNTVKEAADGLSVLSVPEATVGELLSKSGGNLTVTDKDGKAVKADDIVKSGMQITLKDENGKVLDTKTVVVPGDNDGDGKISAADARTALRASVKLEKLNSWQTAASNVDDIKQNSITAADARFILRTSVKLESIDSWMKAV